MAFVADWAPAPGGLRSFLARLRQQARYLDHVRVRAPVMAALHRERLRHRRRRAPEDYADADPFAIVLFPAQRIRFLQRQPFDKFDDVGRILDGDWDRDVLPIEEHALYRAVFERYRHGRSWLQTAFVQEAIARVQAGEAFWHGCRSVAEVHARCRAVDALHASMARRGYQRRAVVAPRSWRSVLDEITINVGRDGQAIRNSSGLHRYCVARALGIEEVPVRILVRHRAWRRLMPA